MRKGAVMEAGSATKSAAPVGGSRAQLVPASWPGSEVAPAVEAYTRALEVSPVELERPQGPPQAQYSTAPLTPPA